MKRCSFVDPECWECFQVVAPWVKGPFCYYHRKIDRGLCQPVRTYLEGTEIYSMFGGRAHNDGRRLDHYTRS